MACDVVAPSLIPVRAGDRVKTDRRDAKKLVSLYRAGLLRFVHPPTAELEGLRDLLRARDDIRCAQVAARNRVLKQLLRHGRIFREGKTTWTKLHRAWIARQRLDDPLAHEALEQLLTHLDGIERQLDALDARLEQVAGASGGPAGADTDALSRDRDADRARVDRRDRRLRSVRASPGARRMARDRPVGVLLRRPAAPRAHHLSGNRHARRLLIEAAWHSCAARRSVVSPAQPGRTRRKVRGSNG